MGKRVLCLILEKKGDMDIDKILNVTLYILQKKEEVSKTKLMKLLFLTDFAHLSKYNRPITWDEYHRLPKGPLDMRQLPSSKRTSKTSVVRSKLQKELLGREKDVFCPP